MPGKLKRTGPLLSHSRSVTLSTFASSSNCTQRVTRLRVRLDGCHPV